MTSRERVEAALNHREPDRVPIDLNATNVSGMQASSVYKLRQALKLDPPGTPVKVFEPFQMLGDPGDDLLDAIGADAVGVRMPYTMFGYKITGWKPWTLFDGTPVLVPEAFNTEPNERGDLLQYPQGDYSAPASARMPKGGFYCDTIIRQEPIDDEKLNPLDNCEEFAELSDDDLSYLANECDRAYASGRAIVASLPGMAFGDIAFVPGPGLRYPKGIRDVEEWYMSTVERPDYVEAVFDRQLEIALKNLPKLHEALGDKPSAVFTSGTDFGAQSGPFVSPRAFRKLYAPRLKAVNDWIHANTTWKTFIHSCGSIQPLLPDIIAAGFDIINPVQTSAANMAPTDLKGRFGDQLTFWGGGVDTQHTLPLASADEIRAG